MSETRPFVHHLALSENEAIGAGTRIWAFAHVMDGAAVGTDCNIGEGVFVESGAVVGDRVTLKNQVLVWNGVTLEDEVFVGPGVLFTNDARPRSSRMPAVRDRYERDENWLLTTLVKRGASIGAGAVILPGVVIGSYAMVGAGAVVTRDVTAHRLIMGNPARPVGWVCVCGSRLKECDTSLEVVCSDCRTRFRIDSDELHNLPAAEMPKNQHV